MIELPQNIWESILDLLDVDELRDLLEMKSFRSKITASSKLMKKLPITIDNYTTTSEEELFSSEFGNQVRKLIVKRESIKTTEDFSIENILRLTPNLEEFSLLVEDSFDCEIDTSPKMFWTKFEHLKTVEIKCDARTFIFLMKCFHDCTKVEKIMVDIVSMHQRRPSSVQAYVSPGFFDLENFSMPCQHIFERFVRRQKNLKHLELHYHARPLLFDYFDGFNPCSFQLESFKIGYMHADEYGKFNAENFYNFLEQQNQIQELNIILLGRYDRKLFNVVFTQLQNLRVLKFALKVIQSSKKSLQKFIDGKISMPNVHTLEILNEEGSCEYLVFVLGAFLNTKRLQIRHMSKIHYTILKEYKQLEELTVLNWHPLTLFDVKFPKLKSFVVVNLHVTNSTDILTNFAENTAQLKTFKCYKAQNIADYKVLLKSFDTIWENVNDVLIQTCLLNQYRRRWYSLSSDNENQIIFMSHFFVREFRHLFKRLSARFEDYRYKYQNNQILYDGRT